MTQPPDERQRPDQPGDVGPDEPTVAWTPPDHDPQRPPEEGGVGWAAVPDEPTGAGTPDPVPGAPEPPPEPAASSPGPPPIPPEPPAEPVLAATEPPPAPLEPPPPAPGGPIISAAPSTPAPPTSGWQSPEPPPSAPGTGWQLPAAAVAAPRQEGYVIAGVGARFVGWLIDVTLVGLIPTALTYALVDWSPIIDEAIRQARDNPTGTFGGTAFTIPLTPEIVIATLIGIGIEYLYFVGFWTSRWRATPGMIGLKMQVVDAATGGPLTLIQATKRWIALGWPLGLLILIPALQTVAGWISLALYVVLFLTTVTNDRKQGLHDRIASSLVIRSATSGNGATFVGCLVWGVLLILVAFIAATFLLGAMWPQLEELIREQTNTNVI